MTFLVTRAAPAGRRPSSDGRGADFLRLVAPQQATIAPRLGKINPTLVSAYSAGSRSPGANE